MKKEQFLEELERLLQDISAEEREEAMQYYRDYFDDAGQENEAQILEELGSPEKVAESIKGTHQEGVFTERGYEQPDAGSRQELERRNSGQEKIKEPHRKEKKKPNGWKIAFLVLVCLLLLPVLLPLGIAVLAVLFAIVAAVVGTAIGIAAAALALLVAGIAVIVVGIGKALLVPAAGLALAGVGLLLLAFGILAVVAIVWCFGKLLPWLIRGIVKLIQYPFRRKEAV